MKTVLVSLPYHFCIRNIVYTPVLHHMGACEDTRFVLLSYLARDGDAIRQAGYSNVVHDLLLPHPSSPAWGAWQARGRVSRLLHRLHRAWVHFDRIFLYHATVARFNTLRDFACIRLRLQFSPAQQAIDARISNFRRIWLRHPFARSRPLFHAQYALRHASMFPMRDPWIETLFSHYMPDAVLLSRAQYESAIVPLMIAARRSNVPVAGVIQSWDQPTSKGPLPPGLDIVIVGSETMRKSVVDHHGFAAERVRNLGHTYLDNYLDPACYEERIPFLGRLGIPGHHRLIVFCTNVSLYKEAEPFAAARLIEALRAGSFESNTTLLIRPHPQDASAREDFAALHDPPSVVYTESSCFGYCDQGDAPEPRKDIAFLVNLMRHADVVVNTASSITLDACAFDTPVVCLCFDHLPKPESDRLRVRYDWDHYAPIVRSGGAWMTMSPDDMVEAIRRYLDDPALHAEGRQRIRQEHLEPFDGHASQRLVQVCREMARKPWPIASNEEKTFLHSQPAT